MAAKKKKKCWSRNEGITISPENKTQRGTQAPNEPTITDIMYQCLNGRERSPQGIVRKEELLGNWK